MFHQIRTGTAVIITYEMTCFVLRTVKSIPNDTRERKAMCECFPCLPAQDSYHKSHLRVLVRITSLATISEFAVVTTVKLHGA